MMITLMNSLAVLLALALLFVFAWGAWRHTVEQILGDPLLADPTPAVKTKRYFTLVGKALWNIAVSLVILGAFLVEFMALMAETKSDEDETRWYDGSLWERDVTGAWYSHGADKDTPSPWN